MLTDCWGEAGSIYHPFVCHLRSVQSQTALYTMYTCTVYLVKHFGMDLRWQTGQVTQNNILASYLIIGVLIKEIP